MRDFDVQYQINRLKRLEKIVKDRANDPCSLGDLYVIPEFAVVGCELAVVLQNLDDPLLWYAVPFDQSDSMVGTWDVVVDESVTKCGGVLRCGRGCWISSDNLPKDKRSGFVDISFVNEAKRVLRCLVGAEEVSWAVRENVDCDPDYAELLDDITKAVTAFESRVGAV